jgi:hypothetical protein
MRVHARSGVPLGAAREGQQMNTTTRDQVIADEQKAVDRAYDCYAERLAEMTGTSAATAAASNKDGIANRLDTEEKAAT